MLVSEKHKALVMALRNPGKVTAVIPKAKVLREEAGRTLLALPHTLDVYKVLCNIGFDPPHPIKHYYHWPTKYPSALPHQIETAAFLSRHPRAYCLNGMGSAKTLSTLWAYDYMRRMGKVKKMLVVAPLSTLERTWADEIFDNFADLEFVVLYGDKKKRLRLLNTEADIYIINHDGIKVIENELVAAGFDVVVYDELTQIARNTRTQRWKSAKRLIANVKYAWGLTGTPVPNNPTDAYGQVKLLTPNNAPRSFTMFRDSVTRLVGPFKRVPTSDAVTVIHDMMQPAIRYATRDCIELPDTIYLQRHVPLTGDQLKAYKRMEREKYFQHTKEDKKVIAVNEAIVAMKLVQILTGAIYDADGKVAQVKAPERLQETIDCIEQAEGKVIVFCPFLAAIDYVAAELSAIYGAEKVATIDGRVPPHVRNATFSSFQKGGDVEIIVAQPSAMSHGLTLTAGSMIIWFAPCYSNETYEQANARIVRPGQKRTTVIVHIEGSKLESNIYDRLKNRQALQGKLLEMAESA